MFYEKDDEILVEIQRLKKCTKIWIDTEVADWHIKNGAKLSLIQILAQSEFTNTSNVSELLKNVVMFDVLHKNELIKTFVDEIMKDEKIEKVFHNKSYDLRYLGGDEAKNVKCTLVLARKFPYHILSSENHKLGTLVHYFYSDIHVDKEEQASEWGIRPLRENQIKYAFLDPVYECLLDRKLDELNDKVNKSETGQSVEDLQLRLTKVTKTLESEQYYLENRIKELGKKESTPEKGERLSYYISLKSLVKTMVDSKSTVDFDIRLTKAQIRAFEDAHVQVKGIKIKSNKDE